MSEHGELGNPGGAGGHDHEGDLVTPAFPKLLLEDTWVLPPVLLSELQELGEAHEQRVIPVGPHARGVDINNRAQEGKLVCLVQEFVDLLLVLGHHEGRADADQCLDQLAGDRRGEEVQCHGPGSLCAELAEQPFGMVVRDDGHIVVSPDAQGHQSKSGLLHKGKIILPGVCLPDPIGFFPDSHVLLSEMLGLQAEDLRQGEGHHGFQALAAYLYGAIRSRHLLFLLWRLCDRGPGLWIPPDMP